MSIAEVDHRISMCEMGGGRLVAGTRLELDLERSFCSFISRLCKVMKRF